jgi:putative transposase
MLLGFKTELKLNNEQRTAMMKHCGVVRHAWNWGLSLTKQILNHNKANSNEKIKFPSAIELHKWLIALVKPDNPWYYECSKSAPQEALRALRLAWDRCFKHISGVPNFKKKGRHDSFTLEGTVKVLGNNRIQVPVIGVLKTYERLPQVPVKSVTISREADRWFISFRLEVELQKHDYNTVVGVDLGVKNLATLSTGEIVEGSKSYRKYEKKLARLQRLNRNKVKGSANWKNRANASKFS